MDSVQLKINPNKINLNVYDDQDGVLSVDVEDSGIGISEKFLPTH